MKLETCLRVVFTLPLACVLGLTACGSDDSTPATSAAAGTTTTSGTTTTAGSLILGGTNNSGKTSFAPAADTCFAVKTAAVLNVNCSNLSGQSFSFLLDGAPAKDVVYNVLKNGAASATNTASTMIYSQLLAPNGTWLAVAGGTIKITDITATSATLQLTGVSLAAAAATTPATGTVTADGSITVTIK